MKFKREIIAECYARQLALHGKINSHLCVIRYHNAFKGIDICRIVGAIWVYNSIAPNGI